MKLKAGHYYKNGSGMIVGPIAHADVRLVSNAKDKTRLFFLPKKPGDALVIGPGVRAWHPDGKFYFPNNEKPAEDLVAEVSVS